MSLASTPLAQAVGGLRLRIEPGKALWLGACVIILLSFLLRHDMPWLVRIEEGEGAPINDWLNVFMDWFIDKFRFIFRAISWMMEWPMLVLREFFQWLPWPAAMAAVCALAFVASGWRLVLFCLLALSYILVAGFWDKAMMTVSLVALSVPLSLGLGLLLGVVGYKSVTGRRIIQPTLDFMQTIPTFAYLIPILMLFGFGPVVGLLASAVYAAPPMARNVMLGLGRVPPDVVESARMSGTTKRQLLWWVQFPSAMPTIMIGVNQTIMAALAMVIIAAVIGSGEDIGFEVLKTLRRAQFGQSLLAGITIVFMAMMMDRISRKFADKRSQLQARQGSLWERRKALWLTLTVMAGLIAISQFCP
jgi:glycine betaine/proline transport system permease protein